MVYVMEVERLGYRQSWAGPVSDNLARQFFREIYGHWLTDVILLYRGRLV